MRHAAGHNQPLFSEAFIGDASAFGGEVYTSGGSSKSLLSLTLALLLSTTLLGGCVNSSVNNALDVAVVSAPDEQLSLDNPTAEPVTATQLASGSVPVPVRSPLTMNTALLPDTEQTPVAQAAADIIDDTADPAQTTVIQTASLQTGVQDQNQTATAEIPASAPTGASVANDPSQGTQLASLSAGDTSLQPLVPPVLAHRKA